MNMDCVLIGTNLKKRFENLKKCSIQLDKYNFKNKNLSLDFFEENTADDFSFFEKNGWNVIKHERKGIFGNLEEGIQNLRSEWVFYCEDDVIVEKIPSDDEMKIIDSLKSANRTAGYISLMFGGIEEGRNVREVNEYFKSPKSYKQTSTDSQIFLNQEKFKNDFFISFPVAIFKIKVLKELIEYIKLYKKNVQVEQAFTQAWFETGIHERYLNLCYTKKFEFKNVKLKSVFTPLEVHKQQFGDDLDMFLENKSFIYTIFKDYIYVKTLEEDWNSNSIQGGKSC